MCRGAVCTGGEVGTQTDRTSVPPDGMGIGIRKRQGGLFEGGLATRHFALVSNIWDWKAGRLMEWHREKAATLGMVRRRKPPTLGTQCLLPSTTLSAN